jgi:uncharacterized protein (DUF885 family)
MIRNLLLITCCLLQLVAFTQKTGNNKALADFFNAFTKDFYKLDPFNATYNGEYQYNDVFEITFTDSYKKKQEVFYNQYLNKLKTFDRDKLNDDDKISYDIFLRNMQMAIESLHFPQNRIPFNLGGGHVQFPQMGSGSGAQPFKTVKDYDNWLKRASGFAAWADSAIVYFKKGLVEDIILPRALVVKIVPQLKALQSTDVTKSPYYGPVKVMPSTFTNEEKVRLTKAFTTLISEQLNPSYNKLEQFISNAYLPKARSTSGLTGVAGGDKMYDHLIRTYTTTSLTADQIFNIGLSEVKRIRAQMEQVKTSVKFTRTLDSFFKYITFDPKFLPYKTADEVLQDARNIQQRVEPFLPALFNLVPNTAFEISPVEAYRAATASPQYQAGLPDGSRPGIYYIPIVDATKMRRTEECVFLHEALPGHHFQVMLQKENQQLPVFRQNGGFSAYSEGWGLYCESLGKQLGCYTDPYQHFYALGFEMHRAIRLVVDVGLHSKGWNREQAIEYMRNNEPITEQFLVSEIERYMGNPGQALSYKIGELKIHELRKKYEKQLGARFKLSGFHDELLRDGAMPLNVLEAKMDRWAGMQ